MKEQLEKVINEALASLDIESKGFVVEHPSDLKMGDYSTNVAIKHGHKEEIEEYLEKNKPQGVEKVELAGPGFINFYLSKDFYKESLGEIIEKREDFGKGEHAKGFKVMIEYTDPNPFKEFHIGHLMSNAIGEALSRIIEANGAEVKRANWQGDVGSHIAKAVWAILKGKAEMLPLGEAYVVGNKAYEEDPVAKEEIEEINKKIYDKSDSEINKIYEEGRRISLECFEKIYQTLGTKFDYYFFESKEGVEGKPLVENHIADGIFEKSDGAVIFRGEKYGLHTRVFINSNGLPTYEAKELGLNKKKFELEPTLNQSIIVTANEITEYFKVLLKAMSLVLPDVAKKTIHIPHGMLRLTTGKMSSRKGNIITPEKLIQDVKAKVKDSEPVAVGAIKYMILRQGAGNDIVFDIEKSVSTEGDSGVYLQYAHARANSILEKANLTPASPAGRQPSPSPRRGSTAERADGVRSIERLLYRFPEIVERAGAEYAPNYITTYLTELAASFNNFYAHEQVIADDPESDYRLAIVQAFKTVMKNGLTILGIPAPERM